MVPNILIHAKNIFLRTVVNWKHSSENTANDVRQTYLVVLRVIQCFEDHRNHSMCSQMHSETGHGALGRQTDNTKMNEWMKQDLMRIEQIEKADRCQIKESCLCKRESSNILLTHQKKN